jgi:hypothetical protein
MKPEALGNLSLKSIFSSSLSNQHIQLPLSKTVLDCFKFIFIGVSLSSFSPPSMNILTRDCFYVYKEICIT